ncbi:MAG: DDE-type integrase/transposase/recombinase, partial [Treponemataceae bacterium]|nr:DDE-type integrase/transposase/recombinase [Treponemataceae bacterium]
MASSLSLRGILDTNKLTGPNYVDWLRNLKIVLTQEKLSYILETPDLGSAGEDATEEELATYRMWKNDSLTVKCIMLASMNNELQRQHDSMDTHSILLNLKELYGEQSRTARYEISKQLFRARMIEGSSVQDHCLKVIDLITRLSQLGFAMDSELSQDLILQSLPDSFSQFVVNYHMNKLNSSLPELLNMLKTAESHIKKDKGPILLVGESSKKKSDNKGSKKKLNPKSRIKKKKEKKISGPGTCFHCGKMGHWKRNCKSFLASVKPDASVASKGMFLLHANMTLSSSDSNSWVLDTGCGSHICKSLHGLQKIRRLKKGDFELYGAGGESIQAEAVGTYILELPSGKFLKLEDCYFMPKIIRNVISIPLLLKKGFEINGKSNGCSISLSNEYYCHGTMENGLLVLCLNNVMFHIGKDNKRKRENINNTLLWHYRLGHISETRLHKLYKDKFFDPYDFESLGTCESCLMGKMTKSPFSGHGERASELLELVHTDVCGPMSTQARDGYSYFITFTDDLSRFGFVYLMKHKSEAFDKFKEYQSMVEKQTGKCIKILRSDRGGEYLSSEFLDYLKLKGILSEWTPPYTPQLNGVAERRNRTLLDMVRSMMCFTNLPISFWGHALETAALVLNRVPSKSVSRTPYEIWKGKKPNLKYLKIWGCHAYVKRNFGHKLSARSDKCIFVGYPKDSLGYIFYNPTEQKVFVARHATFLEKEFFLEKGKDRKIELDEVQDLQGEIHNNPQPDVLMEEVQPLHTTLLRRSERVRNAPKKYGFIIENDEAYIIDNDDPLTYSEAIKSRNSDRWLDAMKSEIDSMYTNQVWTLVDAPEGV